MLLERESELGVLDDLLAGLDTTGGKVVLIRGEAGIGKSVLVRAFLDTHADEAHIYFGSCDDLLTPQPLGPFWDISRVESSLVELLETGERMAVLGALLDLLSRSLRPTALLIEDTHWADEATLDAIKYLGRRIARTNGLLLLTYRDGEVDYEHPLRQVIGELPPENLMRMRLDTLSPQAISDLVGDADLDVEEVWALTDGNPLFVTEVLASGVEGVPSSVQDSVLARAAKLSIKARQLLDLVSVVPGEAERSMIDGILSPTEDLMTECVRQSLLLVDADTVSFHHELTRRAVESALSTFARRRLNADILAELGGTSDLARLVHHAREANDVDSIIEFTPKAARAAIAIGSHREAVGHFRMLEPYLDRFSEADQAAIFDEWARTEYYLANIEAPDIMARAIELHRSRGDDHALARALTFAVRVNENMDRPEAAEACIAEAIAILELYPPSGDLASAVSRRAWLSMMRGDGARAIELADQAIDLAERTGDELTIIHALNTKGTASYSRGDSDGFRLLEESQRRAQLGGYLFEEAHALINMAAAVAERRELEQANDLARRANDTAARYEIPAFEYYARAMHAEVLVWKGEWAAAEYLAADTLGSNPRMNSLHRRHLGWVIGTLQTRRGWPEARTTLDRTWSAVEAAGEMQTLLPVAAALAEYMWLTGEDDPDRITRFREVLDEGLRLGASFGAGDLAFWLWKLGEVSEPPDGIAEPYRLVIEGKPAEGATLWNTMGMPYERALALMHGDEKDRLEALNVLETLGAIAVAAKLRQDLRDEGVTVPWGRARDTRRHAAGLTARQAEVLQLLDEGLTNIEIADRLFVSPRTVEYHVSAVLMKLDSSTREEAVSRARDEGFLPAHSQD